MKTEETKALMHKRLMRLEELEFLPIYLKYTTSPSSPSSKHFIYETVLYSIQMKQQKVFLVWEVGGVHTTWTPRLYTWTHQYSQHTLGMNSNEGRANGPIQDLYLEWKNKNLASEHNVKMQLVTIAIAVTEWWWREWCSYCKA